MNVDSIFNSYRPVEHYFQLIETVTGAKPAPDVPLRGLDAFLMHTIAGAYPAALHVIDLTGDATLGAVRFLWAAHHLDIRTLIGASLSWDAQTSDWRDWLPISYEAFAVPTTNQVILDQPLDAAGSWESVAKRLNKLSPVMIIAANLGTTPQEIAERLHGLTGLDRRVVMVLILNVGQTGDSALLTAASALTADPASAYRFTLLREISPFFAASQMGLICRRDNQAVPEVLNRIREMFDGNFGYASLLESNYKLFQQLQALQNQTVQLSTASAPAAPAPLPTITAAPAAAPATSSTPLQPRSATLQGRLRGLLLPIARAILRRPTPPHRVTYVQATLPRQMRVGQIYEAAATIRNDNKVGWTPPAGSPNGFSLSYHWFSADGGTMIVKEGMRAALPNRIDPGQTVNMTFSIASPQQAGQFILELDVVQEGVTWFSDAGTPGPRFAINVEP
jgi:hypothetical protein